MRTLKQLTVIVTLVIITSCSTNKEIEIDNNLHEESSVLLESIIIDTDGILTQIERSRMPDLGYRSANASSNWASPYATFFISQAKIYAGLIEDIDELAMANAFLDKLEDESSLNLIDIYYTMMLVGEYHIMLSDLGRQNLLEFFDSLYCDVIGAYAFSPVEDVDFNRTAIDHVRPTYLVKTIMSILDMEGRSIDSWMQSTTEEILVQNHYSNLELAPFSTNYHDMLELHRLMGLEVPKDKFVPIIQAFESNLDKVEELSERVFLPIYFFDYLNFSLMVGHNSSNYHELIIQELTNERGFNPEVLVFPLDPLSFYFAVRSLYLVGYNFSDDLNIDMIFNEFDNFLLDDTTYLQPFSTHSSFEDTYYVNQISNILGVPLDDGFNVFYENMLMEVTQMSPYGIYHYLKILEQNDMMHILEPIEEELFNILSLNLVELFDLDWPPSMKFQQIIATIQSLEIMGFDWYIPSNQIDNLLNDLELEETEDLIIEVVYLIFKIRLINLTMPNEYDLSPLFDQLSKKLIYLSGTEHANMVTLQYMAINAFIESSYVIPDNVIKVILDTLYNARHPSGLFKGGATFHDDRASFDTTYQALFMLEYFRQIFN